MIDVNMTERVCNRAVTDPFSHIVKYQISEFWIAAVTFLTA